MKRVVLFFTLVVMSVVAISQNYPIYLQLVNRQEMKGMFISLTDTSITIRPKGSVVNYFTIPANKLKFAIIYAEEGKVNISIQDNKLVAQSKKPAAIAAVRNREQPAQEIEVANTGIIKQTTPQEFASQPNPSVIQKKNYKQPQGYDFVVRKGNTYCVGEHEYDKKEFLNYLEIYNPTAYNHFYTGYRTARTGWWLFGGGLVGEVIGSIMMAAGRTKSVVDAGTVFETFGSACVLSGIICIGTGYGRMHNSADIYNIQIEHKRLMQVNLTASNNGMGFALTW